MPLCVECNVHLFPGAGGQAGRHGTLDVAKKKWAKCPIQISNFLIFESRLNLACGGEIGREMEGREQQRGRGREGEGATERATER